MEEILHEMAQQLYDGKDKQVVELVQQALAEGLSPKEILTKGLIAGMDQVGRDFKAGDIFVPEVLIAARAMHAGVNILGPYLAGSGVESAGKCVLGTVKGDLHDIGKNLVKLMWEGAGFEVVDLGINVEPQTFVAAVRENKPKIVGMSALLTTTMPRLKNTIDALQEAGLRESVRIVIGGAPVTQRFADEIGADAFAEDAGAAVDVARRLIA